MEMIQKDGPVYVPGEPMVWNVAIKNKEVFDRLQKYMEDSGCLNLEIAIARLLELKLPAS